MQRNQNELIGHSGERKPDLPLLKLSVPAEPKFVSFVRRSVQDAIGSFVADENSLSDIMLAVGEACNNAVLYNHTVANASLKVTCYVRPRSGRPGEYDCLMIDIRNTGDGFSKSAKDKAYAMPPAEQMDDHGRGMPLMQMLVDDVEVFGDHNDTVVRLVKHL